MYWLLTYTLTGMLQTWTPMTPSLESIDRMVHRTQRDTLLNVYCPNTKDTTKDTDEHPNEEIGRQGIGAGL